VTAEEHMLNGELGDSVAEFLSRNIPLPLEMVGIDDTFGESGTPRGLMEKYGLTAYNIIQSCKKVIKRK
jgi:transketolase